MLRYTSRSDDPHTHYRKTEKNRVLHGDTSTLRTVSSTQLTAHQYTEYTQYSSHALHYNVFLERLTSLSIFNCLLLIRKFGADRKSLVIQIFYTWAKNVWECSRNCWNSTVNRWPRSTIRSMEQLAHSYLLTIPMHFRGTSRLWYNFSLWRSRLFPKSHNARINKLFATCR